MTFPDITDELRTKLPDLRGRLLPNQSLAELTWFRVGGPAQALFMPEGEEDLAYLLAHLPPSIPVTVVGLGSNLIVRDGGVPGVVIRLGRAFGDVTIEPDARVRAGAAAPDVRVAKAAQEAGIAGLAFLRGIPGAIGGALRRPQRQRRGLADRRHALRLPPLRRARGRDLHVGDISGAAGRSAKDRGRDGAD